MKLDMGSRIEFWQGMGPSWIRNWRGHHDPSPWFPVDSMRACVVVACKERANLNNHRYRMDYGFRT